MTGPAHGNLPRHLALYAGGAGGDFPTSFARLQELAAFLFGETPLETLSFHEPALEQAVRAGDAEALGSLLTFLGRWRPPSGARLLLLGLDGIVPPHLEKRLSPWRGRPLGGERSLLWFLGYGGREEVVAAARASAASGGTVLEDHLLTAGLPDPDLLVIAGGASFIPDFMVHQVSYSEFYFTGMPWPRLGREEMLAALDSFGRRERRYGRVRAPGPGKG